MPIKYAYQKVGLLRKGVIAGVWRQRIAILIADDVNRRLGQAIRKHLGGDLVLGPLDPVEM